MKRPIFVFGSNRRGIHGAGAARFAALHYGAISGQGEGRQGDAYALPTKETPWQTLSLAEIAEHVSRFIAYAESQPDEVFWLTEIGCGYAGYFATDIAPLFACAPANVICIDLEQQPVGLASGWVSRC